MENLWPSKVKTISEDSYTRKNDEHTRTTTYPKISGKRTKKVREGLVLVIEDLTKGDNGKVVYFISITFRNDIVNQ